MNMPQYRIFVKDCLNLGGKAKSNIDCLSFHIARDVMEKKTSTFNLAYIDTNIDIGDVLGLYDQYGTNYYIGVVSEIDVESNQITCDSNISYFNYEFVYDALRGETGSTEELIKKQFDNVFFNSTDYLMQEKYGAIETTINTNIVSHKLPLKEELAIVNFFDFLFDCFDSFGIICDFKAFFNEQNPTLTIDASTQFREPIKLGNNTNVLRNFAIETDEFENNKLVVYSEDGTQYRGTWYGSANGITEDSEELTRSKKINCVYAFSDDEISIIKAQHLRNKMFNHKISFDLVLNNSLYNFYDLFVLGCPVEVYYNGIYYNTIFTGYEYIKENGQEVSSVRIYCGKVRNNLTSKLLKYVRK